MMKTGLSSMANTAVQIAVDAYLHDPHAFAQELALRGHSLPCWEGFEVGDWIICRTLTYHYVGKIKAISGMFLTLEEACWINSSGAWERALASGELTSIETYPPGFEEPRLNIMNIVECNPWPPGKRVGW